MLTDGGRRGNKMFTREGGIALVQVIIVGAALFSLATTALVMTRSDQMVSNNVVNGMKAFWIASAGLERAKNCVRATRNLATCAADADLTGPQSFADGTYTVTFSQLATARFRITSVGAAPNNARKVLEEIVLAPGFDGDDGLIQIDGGRFPTRLWDPRFGDPGWRIPDWTIDGRNHNPVTYEVDESCPPAPPLGGPADDAKTAVEKELDDLRCRIVERANECCGQDGNVIEADPDSGTGCYWVGGFCQPGICEDPGGSCLDGVCDVEDCYPGSCRDETCIAAKCPIASGGCRRGSCEPTDEFCAAGSCVVDMASCDPGTCADESCTPGTCAVGTCTPGICQEGEANCVSGTCNTKNEKCSAGGSCGGKPNCETATCTVDTTSCVPGTCNSESCAVGTCDLVLPCTPSGCTGDTCVSAACTIDPCAQGECTDDTCAAGSCTATCRPGDDCPSGNCVSGTCGVPECRSVCNAECTPGLYYVRGDGEEPNYDTHYWTDRDQTNEVPDPPGDWAVETECNEADPGCCKSMNLEDEELRATTKDTPGANPPDPPADRGPLIPDTTDDRTDPFPIKYLTSEELDALSEQIDATLDAALIAGVDRCIDTARINGETQIWGTLAAPEIVVITDPNDPNPRVAALSGTGNCQGSRRVNNLTITGGSIIQGAGILIIPREIDIRDAIFEWKGLVLVMGNGRIEAWDDACGGIWGGVLMQRNPNPANNERVVLNRNLADPTKCAGYPNNAFSINYSCEGVRGGLDLLFQTVAWREVFGG